jgi:hypothetical protein
MIGVSEAFYYIASEGKQQGPFSLDIIAIKIKKNELHPTDYIYDESKKDWVLLIDFEPLNTMVNFSLIMKTGSNKSVPSNRKDGNSNNGPTTREWFVLKGENKFGPFLFHDVVRLLQEKNIFEYDYVWYSGLSSWKRVAELEDFSADNIKKLKGVDNAKESEIFFRRRHARASYGASIIVHDNKKVFKGQGLEISAGGAAVMIESSALEPGQSLFLHFKPGDGVPPFNAVCEVISKQGNSSHEQGMKFVRYGVRFTNISQETQKSIKEYAVKKVA